MAVAVECDRKGNITMMGAWMLDKRGVASFWSSNVLDKEDRYMIWHDYPDRINYEYFGEIHIAPLHRDEKNICTSYLRDRMISKFYVSSLRIEKPFVHADEPTRYILYKDKAIPNDAVLLKFWPIATCEEQITITAGQFQIDIAESYSDTYCINTKGLPLYLYNRPAAYLTFRRNMNESIALYDFQILPHMEKTYMEYRRDNENEDCGL